MLVPLSDSVVIEENEEDSDDLNLEQQGNSSETSQASTAKKRTTEIPLVPGKGISDTRWVGRAFTLHRFSKPHVLEATVKTMDYIIETTSDPKARAPAIRYKATLQSPSFIVLLAAFNPVLAAVNTTSEYLQSPDVDIGTAMSEIEKLKLEIQTLRLEAKWEDTLKNASTLAKAVGFDLYQKIEECESTRPRKLPRKLDERPETHANFSFIDKIRTQHFLPAVDKIIAELQDRFPPDLADFKYLQPAHFGTLTAEEGIKRLAERYKLDVDKAVSQWRLFRHTKDIGREKKTARNIYLSP